ncbi:MAG: dienelactone hydrolase family protein [Myxococcota bacterium]|nr:dienelactone hydrolase family protein [Myxococcota bacterium]
MIGFNEEQLELVREDGVRVPARRYMPEIDASQTRDGAGVVVLAGERGLTEDVLSRLVAPIVNLGFFALAFDVVGGRATDSDDDARERAAFVDHAGAIDELALALTKLREMAYGKLAVVGVDAGAAIAIEAATVLPRIDAVVHAGGPPPASTAKLVRMRAPLQIHRTDDGPLTADDASAIEAAVAAANNELQLFDYPARHGFLTRPRDAEEEHHAIVAWERIRDFLTGLL